MANSINTNIGALTAQKNMVKLNADLDDAMNRLSSVSESILPLTMLLVQPSLLKWNPKSKVLVSQSEIHMMQFQ